MTPFWNNVIMLTCQQSLLMQKHSILIRNIYIYILYMYITRDDILIRLQQVIQ